ncbi:MAG: hypothetical protein R2748_24170 [Bryobacterales bacterium]
MQKSGAWYSYGDERIGQGRENAKQFLKDNLDARDKLEKELRAALGLPTSARQPSQRMRKTSTRSRPARRAG